MGWLARRRERRRRERRERQRELEMREANLIEWAREHSVGVVVKKNGRVFIDIHAMTENGFTLPVGAPLALDSSDDATLLGETILKGLSQSNREFLPERNLRTHPLGGEVFELRKVKSWAEWVRHARLVSIRADYDDVVREIRITPWHNHGRNRVSVVEEGEVTIVYESPEHLGRAVQEAIALASTV